MTACERDPSPKRDTEHPDACPGISGPLPVPDAPPGSISNAVRSLFDQPTRSPSIASEGEAEPQPEANHHPDPSAHPSGTEGLFGFTIEENEPRAAPRRRGSGRSSRPSNPRPQAQHDERTLFDAIGPISASQDPEAVTPEQFLHSVIPAEPTPNAPQDRSPLDAPTREHTEAVGRLTLASGEKAKD
jgi:hypothetical protein